MTQFIFFNLYKTTSAQYLFVDFQFSFLVMKNNNNINNDDDNNNNAIIITTNTNSTNIPTTTIS